MTKYIFVTGGVVSSLGKGIVAASLGRLLKNRGLNVWVFVQIDINEAFIVTEIQISLCTIIGHENFTVLIWAHRPWVNVDVWIEFLDRNF